MEARDTLSALAEQFALAFQPLANAFNSAGALRDFLEELGWDFNAPPPPLNAVRAPVQDLFALVDKPDGLNAADLAQVVIKLRAAFQAISQLESAAGLAADFRNEFPRQLIDYLVVEYLLNNQRRWGYLLMTLGIVTLEEGAAAAPRPAYLRRRFEWDQLSQLLHDPLPALKSAYCWGQSNFDRDRLVQSVSGLLDGCGLEVRDGLLSETAATTFNQGALHPDALTDLVLRLVLLESAIDPAQLTAGVGLFILPETASAKPGFALLPFATAGLDEEFALNDRLSLTIRGELDLTSGAGILVRPNQDVAFLLGFDSGVPAPASGNLSIILRLTSGSDPFTLIGDPTASRFEVSALSTTAGTRLGANGKLDVFAEFALEKGKIVIKPSPDDIDGFLTKLFPADGLTLDANLTIGTSSDRGIYFSGSGGLEVSLPLHIQLGPIEIQSALVAFKPADGKIPLDLAATVKAGLGPLTAVVQNVGIKAIFSFPPKHDGNLGPVQFDLGFRPPDGVGLSIDAGVVKGGGFLSIDVARGEYVGALELDFKGLFSVKAIGIINTKMPDGSKGFSLLIVIAAEFTPIQLSFGFTLNGVGGIFGLNRMIVVAALAEGIRTNAVKSILFPENVIANISRIISDIKQFFPPQQDHFVIAPMAKLGWGTPSIITVELGLLLDLPNPMFAIVGVLKAILPEEDAPILRLQVNFLGVVDFDRGYIFFRADLFDSRLLVYSITGSMAFLVSWGEAKALALSVGGFHPDFRDIPSIPALPDGFRSMARIGISLLSDDNPRLKVESYFAVTSNTLQFGARVELYAEAGGFNVYGFLGYDVLFQRDPFRFVAKLSGGIALRRHSSVIAGVNISATLSGPTPWDACGTATLSLLFFSISVGFHATWGDPLQTIAAAIEDLLKLLQRELADTRNWRADLPPNNHLHVSVRKIDLPAGTDMLVIHPAGVLTFSQRSLPLEDFLIAKFGTKKPLAESKFKLTSANSGGAEIPADYQGVREQFAPANFLDLSDSDKLSRKSFDNLPSGFKLTATSDLLTTLPVVRPVDYELSYLRRERIVPKGLIELFVRAYDRLVKGSAVRQSGLAQQQKRRSLNAPPQVELPQETFAIANAADLKSQVMNGSGPVFFATQAEAYQQQQELITQNPALAGQIQVVSHFELNPN